MADVYIFDALRTPRGRGKKNGSLHEVKPVSLVSGLQPKGVGIPLGHHRLVARCENIRAIHKRLAQHEEPRASIRGL